MRADTSWLRSARQGRLGWTIGLIGAALMVVTQAGCVGPMGPMGPMGPGMHGPGGANQTDAPSPAPGAPELVVTATEFAFEPGELRIRVGTTVNLTLDNGGQLYHDLSISDLGFVLAGDPGVRSSGALTITEVGRFRFVCSVPGHAEAGMTGTLVVEAEF